MVGFIYKIANDFNSKVYIGYTNDAVRRRAEHFSPCQFKRKTKLYNSIRKYGIDKFTFEVLYCSQDEEYCLTIMEPYFIKEFNSYNTGYNCTYGGDKRIFTTEIKAKISKSKMGHIVTEATREKLSAHNRANWKIIFPNNDTIITKNLKQFCKEHNLNYSSLIKTNATKQPCYGYKSLKMED